MRKFIDAEVKEAASFDQLKSDIKSVTVKPARAVGRGIKKMAGSLFCLSLLMLAMIMGISNYVLAEGTTIPFTEISLDWTSFASTLGTKLAAVIAVSIGVGIGVWAIRLVYRIFKSFARG